MLMASTHLEETARNVNIRPRDGPQTLRFRYPGRVRTGCLTCRARKVKCDEQHPACFTCIRLKRTCVYKTKSTHQSISKLDNSGRQNDLSVSPWSTPNQEQDPSNQQTSHSSQQHLICPNELCEASASQRLFGIQTAIQSSRHLQDFFSPPGVNSPLLEDRCSQQVTMDTIESPSAQSLRVSQDIYLCTTIDLMAATEVSIDPSLSHFVREVNPPLLFSFDRVNWERMQIHVTKLARHDDSVAAAARAVQALYKTQANGLSTSHALSLYHTATNRFHTSLENGHQSFDVILIAAFLLCLFETLIPEDTGCIFGESDGALVQKIEAWSLQDYQSPLSLRIAAWLSILHAAARRGGNPGLASNRVKELLRNGSSEVPSLSLLEQNTEAYVSLYDLVSAPVFSFFLEIQLISAQVANLSHYHRSRITTADQDEVDQLMTGLKNQLFSLWLARPGPMRLEPSQLRSQLSVAVAEPLIALVGLCAAKYHAEIVDVGRTFSDPPLASLEAKQSMRHIRKIIEGDWNASIGGRLNSGYLRPLFMYTIESMDADDIKWAVDSLKQIKDPICRSDFFASFAEALSHAQMSKGRRVTMRYFCYQAFGVLPPFL